MNKAHDDLGSRTMSQLREQVHGLRQAVNDIQGQIDRAEAIESRGGSRANRNWLARARHAMHKKEILAAELEEAIRRRERTAEIQAQRTYVDAFVAAARKQLPAEQFRMIELHARSEAAWPEQPSALDREQISRQRKRERALRRFSEKGPVIGENGSAPGLSATGDRLRSAETMYVAARNVIDVWRAGETVPVNFYEELAEALDAWEFST